MVAGKESSNSSIPIAMARIYAAGAIEKVERTARKIIATLAEGDMARTQFTILRRLAKHDPADTVALRRQVAQHIVKAGRYAL
jgi:butyryl-CoA dehydrogenase